MLCIVLMLALQRTPDISVDVVRSQVEHASAVVTLHLVNRTGDRETLDYDLVILKNGHPRTYGGISTIPLVRGRHIAGVQIGPHEDRTETIQIAIPSQVTSIYSRVENLMFRRTLPTAPTR